MSTRKKKIIMNYKFKTKPYAHQIKALEKSVDKKNYAYFMEMGTGKSKVLVDNMSMLYDKGKINGALIIAPKGVYNNWFTQEIPIHLASHIQPKMVLWTASTSKAKDKEYQSLFQTGYDLHILIMNVEALSTDKGRLFAGKFLRAHRAIMAIDESTTIKNHKAIRTRNVLKLSEYSKYKRILTGSPVTKSPLDLYTQCDFLDTSHLGFSSYFTFRNRYCVTHRLDLGNGKYTEIPKYYVHLDELEDKLSKFSYRVTKDECLDLPPKLYSKRYIDMNDDQKDFYERLRIAAIAIIEDEAVSYNNKLTEIIKLHQVCNGFVKTNDGELKEFKNPKLHALSDIIEESEGKVIIWANYIYNIESIIKFQTE